MLGCWWLVVRWLLHSVILHPHQDATLLQCGAAAAGFLCFSAGAVLAAIGAHIFDEVELSDRWARCSFARSGAGRRGAMPDFRRDPTFREKSRARQTAFRSVAAPFDFESDAIRPHAG